MDSNRQELIEKTLFFVANKGWEEHGGELLNLLAKFLGESLNINYVLIGKYSKYNPEIIETVSIFNRDVFLQNIVYELLHTPCENVIGNKLCCYVENIQNLFPKDELLKQMNVDNYIGIPLWGSSGEAIGLIAIMGNKPLTDVKTMELILQIVAIKAAHEIEKMLFETEIEIKNKKLSEKSQELQQKYNELISNEEKLLQAKEKAEESDRLKSAFLANMSHEIRTPMNGILGFASLLKEPNLNGEEQQEYISIIEKSGARMLNIINDIVDISKIESGMMKLDIKESNINEQLEYVYTFFKPEVEAKGMKLLLKNSLAAEEVIIKTDREKVFAVLINLVKNAIKYSNKGTIELGYIKNGDFLEFYVKDTGIGIPKERQSAIFERFIQADIENQMARQGAGLGLSIAKSYIEMLGGKIWVESQEGIGSTFYFTLACNTQAEGKSAIEKIVLSQNEKIKNLKILISEDDETSEKIISIYINELSKEIIIAKTGNEAVEICHNNPDIDLVLMDIQMPEMDGYEATRQIRKFNKDVIIIAQTAYGLSHDKEKAFAAGCNNYITKPINKNELLLLIQKYFKK